MQTQEAKRKGNNKRMKASRRTAKEAEMNGGQEALEEGGQQHGRLAGDRCE